MANLANLPDYGFYTIDYGGSNVSQNEIARFATQSEHLLRRYERTYQITYPQGEHEPAGYHRRLAICALMDEVKKTERATGGVEGVVRSKSIGSVSLSYENGVSAEKALESKGVRYLAAIQTFADVYRGVR